MSHVHTSVSASDVLVVRCASNPRFPQNYVANFAELSCGFLFVEEVESKPVKEHNAGEGDSFVHCIGLDLDRVPAKKHVLRTRFKSGPNGSCRFHAGVWSLTSQFLNRQNARRRSPHMAVGQNHLHQTMLG